MRCPSRCDWARVTSAKTTIQGLTCMSTSQSISAHQSQPQDHVPQMCPSEPRPRRGAQPGSRGDRQAGAATAPCPPDSVRRFRPPEGRWRVPCGDGPSAHPSPSRNRRRRGELWGRTGGNWRRTTMRTSAGTSVGQPSCSVLRAATPQTAEKSPPSMLVAAALARGRCSTGRPVGDLPSQRLGGEEGAAGLPQLRRVDGGGGREHGRILTHH